MSNIPISIVTPTFQSDTFSRCRRSVLSQKLPVEHVIIDGMSGEPWYSDILKEVDSSTVLISEPDEGIYDALNKGIGLCRGELVGVLHSDDVYQTPNVLKNVVKIVQQTGCDVVYGDLVYVDSHDKPIRYWRSGHFRRASLVFGWMPPHPTLFIRRNVFARIGLYNESYRIAGDYEFVLRLFRTTGLRVCYIPTVLTRMSLGGVSNRSIAQILNKTLEDVRAMKAHGISPLLGVPTKNLRKVFQFSPVLRHDSRKLSHVQHLQVSKSERTWDEYTIKQT